MPDDTEQHEIVFTFGIKFSEGTLKAAERVAEMIYVIQMTKEIDEDGIRWRHEREVLAQVPARRNSRPEPITQTQTQEGTQ